MRTAGLRRAAAVRALIVTLTGLILTNAAEAQRNGALRVSPAPAAGPAEGEDDRYFARANALRARILRDATWAGFEGGQCHEGALRVFLTDSGSASSDITRAIAELERIVVARGVEAPLDSAPVVQLFSTVIGWETGVSRPFWDVPDGEPRRETIAAGLTGEFLNPVTNKCELLSPFDTMRIVLPEGVSVAPPPSRSPTILIESGPAGLNRLRDDFFVKSRDDVSSVMTYTHVIAVAYWRDYAVIAVNRPAELRGAVLTNKTAGGAAYLFHRVDGEWQLLTITRTWS
ncbi:MAG TPA: hypothetical protein VK922_00970 [Gemmatimonadaceae bacterium]|nr:hypothetical protein [Gemmatimonadaceae bacterium]